MSSKRAGLPSLNSAPSSSKKPLQPVKVQRYRAGQAPEGYVDPALQSSDDENQDDSQQHGVRVGRGGINMAIGGHPPEEPKMAYQVLNVEKMTLERQVEKSRQLKSGRAGSEDLPVVHDRRLQRLQAIDIAGRRSRGDIRSRRQHGSTDVDDEEEDKPVSDEDMDDEEEASLRRRKALSARAMRAEDEELLGFEDEDDDDDDEDSNRRTKERRTGEVCYLIFSEVSMHSCGDKQQLQVLMSSLSSTRRVKKDRQSIRPQDQKKNRQTTMDHGVHS